MIRGMVLYSDQGEQIGQIGQINPASEGRKEHKTTVDVAENEKILGVRGKLATKDAHHIASFEFIIGQVQVL